MSRVLLGVVASGAAVVLSIAMLPSRAATPIAAPIATVAPTAVTAQPTTTTTIAPKPTVASTPVPYDRFAHREQIENADLAALQAVDITKDGYVAASAIARLGKLAAAAPIKEQRDAIRTLDLWLRQESKRGAQESIGNVSIIVDALEETKSNEAIAPLVSALDSMTLPLHIETRIVEALTTLQAKSAVSSIERFKKRVAGTTPGDDFEKELTAEAMATADNALSALR
jgi:hypothetical protein